MKAAALAFVAAFAVCFGLLAWAIRHDIAERDDCTQSTCDVGRPVMLKAYGEWVCACVVAPWSKQ